MIQNQLIDYISAQMKAGMSKEAITAALSGAGWQAGDIDETMKKMESESAGVAMSGQPGAIEAAKTSIQPAVTAAAAAKQPVVVKPDIIGGVNPARPAAVSQPVIKVSDFVGAGAAASSPAKTVMKTQTTGIGSASIAMGSSAPKGGKILMVVEIVLILALAGLSIFLYTQNSSLSGQLSTLNAQGGSVATQITTLTNQVKTLTTQNTSSSASISALTAQNSDLSTNLSLLVAPANATGTMTGTVAGVASGAGANWIITTDQNVKLTVKNANEANVSSALAQVAGKSAQFTGTYTPATKIFAVTMVNGASTAPTPVAVSTTQPVAAPTAKPVATSTATTTAK